MPNRVLVIGVVVAIVVLLLVGLLVTASGEDTFTVVIAPDEEQQVDLGEEGPSIGDLYVFSGPLLDESEETQLGRADGQCTTTSSPGPSAEARWVCNVTSTFSEEREGAEIDAQGVGRIEAEDVVFAVTGGTGTFGMREAKQRSNTKSARTARSSPTSWTRRARDDHLWVSEKTSSRQLVNIRSQVPPQTSVLQASLALVLVELLYFFPLTILQTQ